MSVDNLIFQVSTKGFDTLTQQLNAAGGNVDALEGKWQGVAKLLGAGVALGGLNAISNNMIRAGDEAANMQQKLKAMLEVRGEPQALQGLQQVFDTLSKQSGLDDDPFYDLSAHLLSFGLSAKQVEQILPGVVSQASTMGQSLDSVGDSFGRAFASGNVGALTRSGVVLSQADKDAIKLAKSTSEAAGQQELFNRVLASYAQYAVGVGAGTTEAARAHGYFAKQVGDAQETMGQGASEARAKWQQSLTPFLEGLNQEHAGWLKNIGAVTEYATVAGNVVGPIYGLVRGFAELHTMHALATATQKAETAAEAAKVPVANAQAGALGSVATAAKEAAGKVSLLAKAQGLLGTQVGNLSMVGGEAVTVGGALASGAVGAVAGYGVSDDLKSLGYDDGASNTAGMGVGVAAAAASMFIPGAIVPIAMATGVRLMFNELVNVPMERAAEAGTGLSDEQTAAMPKMSLQQKADVYNQKATEALEGGDAVSAESFRLQALSFKKQARAERTPDAATGLTPSEYAAAQGRLSAFAANRPQENARMNRDAEDATAYRDEVLGKSGKSKGGAGAGLQARQLEQTTTRNGTTRTIIEVTHRESSGDKSARALKYNTMTAAPQF